jgi:hypothetical protein
MSAAKFFIRDCNGQIVGNPQGYRTIKGAITQKNLKGSPVWRAIWQAYSERELAYVAAGTPVSERENNLASISED